MSTSRPPWVGVPRLLKGRSGIWGSTWSPSASEEGADDKVDEEESERARVAGAVAGVAGVAGVVGAGIDLFLDRLALGVTFSLPLAVVLVLGAELGPTAAGAAAFPPRRSG